MLWRNKKLKLYTTGRLYSYLLNSYFPENLDKILLNLCNHQNLSPDGISTKIKWGMRKSREGRKDKEERKEEWRKGKK